MYKRRRQPKDFLCVTCGISPAVKFYQNIPVCSEACTAGLLLKHSPGDEVTCFFNGLPPAYSTFRIMDFPEENSNG